MSNDAVLLYSTVVGPLVLVALLASAGLLVYRLVRGLEASNLLGVKAIWLAWLEALVATVGSLIYSEVIHFTLAVFAGFSALRCTRWTSR